MEKSICLQSLHFGLNNLVTKLDVKPLATRKYIIIYITCLCFLDSNSKPTVECSVVTEFTDHICVTMDAELIMFLHDLVSAYLKEKEKGEDTDK